MRASVVEGDLSLKIEMINDVPSHVGGVTDHPVLGRLDSAENILANKLTALMDRREPKDLADVWGFCCRSSLKASGLFAPDLARVLLGASEADWRLVLWDDGPDAASFATDLHRLGEALLLSR